MTARPTPPRRWPPSPGTIAIALAGVVGLVIVIVVLTQGDETASPAEGPPRPDRSEIVQVAIGAGVGDPTEPTLPESTDLDATSSFFDEDGSAFLEMAAVLSPVLDEGTPSLEECQLLAEDLESIGDPTTLYTLAATAPDPTASELLVALTASTTRFLQGCEAEDAQARSELAYQWVLFDRWLDENGLDQ